MPRYSTASASDSEHNVQGGLATLNSTPRFQLPSFPSTSHDTPDDDVRDEDDDEDEDDDDDQEEAWDEVDIPTSNQQEQPTTTTRSTPGEPGPGREPIEIVIARPGKTLQQTKDDKKRALAQSREERKLRQERHKVHVMTLFASSLVRNHALNDKELQARLISQIPSSIHAALASITRERYPNPRDRSRLFEATLRDLVSWWYSNFDTVPHRHVERRSIDQVETELASWQRELNQLEQRQDKGKGKQLELDHDDKGDDGSKGGAAATVEIRETGWSKYKEFPWQEDEQLSFEKRKKRFQQQESRRRSGPARQEGGGGEPTSTTAPIEATSSSYVRMYKNSSSTWEPIRTMSTLYAAASNLRGSRDLCCQLFVALLRGLDVPARLVVSLQGMEWRSDSASGKLQEDRSSRKGKTTGKGKGKGKGKGSGKTRTKGGGKSTTETIELSSTTTASSSSEEDERLGYKVPKVNLRRSAPSKKRLATWQRERQLNKSPSPDLEQLNVPPTQWPEVYSRYLKEWITLDPTRKLVRCKTKMEPQGKPKPSGNSLAYVVGFEEDGSVHDVTPRYSKSYNNKTIKLRVPTSSQTKRDNKGQDWFTTLLEPWKRSYQLNRDKVEEEELWNRSRNEPFPTSFGGFKSHPNFVLEQHLHRDEALIPGTKPLGLFKSTHPVFPRSGIVTVKSVENWYRIGRALKTDHEVPIKFVKGRTVTIHSKRKEELLKLEGGEVDDQPLYSFDQTVVYVPDPVVDGKVPKNSFGNIDLFVPSMLPHGAVHLESKLAAKCAKMLQIDFAEAIVGFEFRQRRATPTIRGIVVASEHASTIRTAISNLEQVSLEREFQLRQDRVLKRWKKLVTGLRIRQRLQGQFKEVESGIVGEAATMANAASASASASGSVGDHTPRRRDQVSSAAESSRANSPASPAQTSRKRAAAARRRLKSRSSSSSSSQGHEEVESSPPPRKRTRRRRPTPTPPPPPTGTRTSTRASAMRAKQVLAATIARDDNGDDDGEAEQQTDEVNGGRGHDDRETGQFVSSTGRQRERGNGESLVERADEIGRDGEERSILRKGSQEREHREIGGTRTEEEEQEEEGDEFGFEYESD
ncbi:hypothetical protein JCM3766R1_002411 [Sporobolomyces carnicolor]